MRDQLVRYLLTHPHQPLMRVSVATGLSEDEIRGLAREGGLPYVPAGAEPERTCSCPPGQRNTCPACRAARRATTR